MVIADSLENFTQKYEKYLEQIRHTALLTFLVFFSIFTLAFLFSKPILNLFLNFFNPEDIHMVITSPFQAFTLSANTGFVVATIFTFPIFILNIIRFLFPALNKQERQQVIRFVTITILLFITGFIFGVITMRYIINAFSTLLYSTSIDNFWDVGTFSSQILLTATLLGLVFEYPVLLVIMVRTGLIPLKSIISQKPFIILCAIVFVSLLPPTDLVSMVAMCAPILVLLEITIIYLKKTTLKNK